MKVAFLGDVHGCVLHALGAAVLLARHRRIRLDAVIQVGDLGAFPSAERWDEPSRRFGAEGPAQSDFFRLLDPSSRLGEGVRMALGEIPPLLFLSGNHEDHEWLAGLHRGRGAVTPVDPLGVFQHVVCGHIAEVAGQRVAFLGRVELDGYMDLDPDAHDRLLAAEPGSVDVLVTHDGPYGMSSWRGVTQGSRKLSRLIEHLQPRLHVSGHYHHQNGPRRYGATVSYALAQLIPPKRDLRDSTPVNPRQQVAPGSIGLFDTRTLDFEYVHDSWLADVRGDRLDLAALIGGASSG
ncbi:metallophosphoesterase [Actinomadura sp. NEAU-AAG7]|uniref:metallophosphoesterase family protein n=1 Tax=Actinomadura sp. NEAU-AAG7 TaxID=2839640 RepID=UPI001BE4CE32|nr:metallophosphoesterase [Actinomadura sp. NEAU-AAG7]MBT2206727.1 metallophosphoesterase [Actinomadura sp. NEAU-AAG7]